MKTALSYRREAFRLWFEFLRVAYGSPRQDVQDALKHSAPVYKDWGDVTKSKFDSWWKEKSHLFEEKYVVRRLKAGDLPADPQALIVEIPLTQSPTVLIERVARIVHEASALQSQQSSKSKRKPTSLFKLTGGAEPKLAAVREMLTVYRDVHLKNPKLRGKALLNAVESLYLERRNKRWAKLPDALRLGPNANEKDIYGVLRNLRRYIAKAERVMLNVAKGEFPGRY